MKSQENNSSQVAQISPTRWEPTLDERAFKTNLPALVITVVIFLLVSLLDISSFPEHWPTLVTGRVIGFLVGATCLLLNRKKIMNNYWFVTVPMTFIFAHSGLAYAFASLDFYLTLNISIFAMLLTVSLILVLKLNQVLIIIFAFVVCSIIGGLSSDTFSIEEWSRRGGLLIMVGIALTFLVTQSRNRTRIREITTNLALKDSQVMLAKQNKSLEEAKKALERVNSGGEQEVEQQAQSLQTSNQERDQMIYRLSHDFKSPMINIRSMLTMARIVKEKEQLDEIYSRIDQNLDRFDDLVKDLDNFVSYANFEVSRESFAPKQLVRNVWSAIPSYLSDGTTLEIVSDFPEQINSDPKKLSLVLNAVIRNSIQYRRQEVPGKIKVTCFSRDGQCHLEIKDNGRGIPKEILPKIFDFFFRGDARSRGLGIGLYLAKGSIESLGGEIKVSSEGIGTTVELIFPV